MPIAVAPPCISSFGPNNNRVGRVRRGLELSSVLLILVLLAIGLWCVKKPLHKQYLQVRVVCFSKFAQALDHTHFVESPRAHSLLPDIAQLARYRAANRSLPFLPDRVVFYGDSITDFWPTAYKAQFFPGKPYIGRGITGQSTDVLAWRFQQDVIELHPSVVVILAGTNDVVLSKPHRTYQQTTRNIQTMVEMAKRHKIRVILCSILPVSHFPQAKQAIFNEQIRTLNTWLRNYATEQQLTYVDYYGAMADQTGAVRSSLTVDGLHPNKAGYAIMRSLAQAAIDRSS